jgi:hypothetical protein
VKPLREWSGRRVVAVALAWLVGLPMLTAPAVFGGVAWLARAERERAITAVPDSLAPGLRVDYLPPQPSDFYLVTSFANPGVTLLLGLLLLPPLALCLTWLVVRRRRSDQFA